MFWSRVRREARQQRVLDELLTLDPGNRRERLEVAVAAHELRPEEVGPALHLVERLDRLREMRVRPGGHLPGWANLPQSRQAPAPEAESRAPAQPSINVGIPVVADADPDPVAAWPGAVDLPLDATEAVSRKAGRRWRKGRPGVRVTGPVRRTALASLPVAPDAGPIVGDIAVHVAADESWPSIAWLRP